MLMLMLQTPNPSFPSTLSAAHANANSKEVEVTHLDVPRERVGQAGARLVDVLGLLGRA